jgi:localization factor PodJL
MAYAQRLERDADVGVREAFRALHQGLSCLAGQINATDSHSAHVAAQLTSNWEQLARRMSDMRMDFDDSHRELDTRLAAAEKVAGYSSSALDHALEKVEAFARRHALDQAENQRHTRRHEQALERLSDAFLRLEKRPSDSDLAARVEAVEQAVGQMAGQNKPDSAPLLSALQALSHRLERLEKDHGALLSELRARLFDTPAARMPLPPVAEQPHAIEPPALDPTDSDSAEVPDFEDLFSEPEPENFLSNARMGVRTAPDLPRSRYLFPAAAGLVALLAAVAGLALYQREERPVIAQPAVAGVTFSLPQPPSLDDTQFTVAPQADENNSATLRLTPVSEDASPTQVPRKQRQVHTAPVRPVPDSPKLLAQPVRAPAPPIDRTEQLADQGNAAALTVLGLRALDGSNGAAVHLPEAIKYLTEAAEKGQAVAQYRLGTLYDRGLGVAVDPAKAAHWYELSANQGNRKAMHNLAVIYADRKDMANAARWFAKAASLGLSDSQFNLAILYEHGDGVPQSLVEAFKWYSIAAATGDTESKARVIALQTQLNDADKAAAQKEIEAFHPLPFDHGANVPPQAGQLVSR